MPETLNDLLSTVIRRIGTLAADDQELRDALRSLAREFLASDNSETPPRGLRNGDQARLAPPANEISDTVHVEGPIRPRFAALAEAAGDAQQGDEADRVEPTTASHVPQPPPRIWSAAWQPVTDADLPLIETRCRLKADGSRWAAARQRRIAEGADFRLEIEPLDREIIERAKALEDCFLWMNHPSGPSPSDLSLFDDLAGCYEALAAAVSLVKAVRDERHDAFEQSLDLLAEAQSALRAAVLAIDGPVDADQARVYTWLKNITGQEHIYIHRFMRADDPADPAHWSDLYDRVEALEAQFQELRRHERQRRKRLNKLRYVASQISDGDGEHYWRTIAQTIEELVDDGVPPSNREIRDILLPHLETLPPLDLSSGFQMVLREIDRFRASRPPEAESRTTEAPIPQVREAARLLRGRAVVLIGGERRPENQQSLESAFGLKELIWVEGKEHQSVSAFEPHVARPDVAVVLLAIRWSSHGFGDVKQFCDRYGKPLVRLPAGYSPNQVAVQILSQCSERLAGAS